MVIELTGRDLSLEDVEAVAFGAAEVALSTEARSRMVASRAVVDDLVASDQVVYGVTTGFGDLASRRISSDDVRRLQENLLLSHSVGVGSVVLTINVVLIAGYTFGCHSLRHLVGGGKDCMSCGRHTARYEAWKRASWFNARHMQFAWASLLWVMVTDLYVRLVSMGHLHDYNTW